MLEFKVRSRFYSLFLILCSLVFASNAFTATINASGNSLAAVQTAVNSASEGDAVVIPPGTVQWSGTLSITKKITLSGQGSYAVDANHNDIGTWPLKITTTSGNSYPLITFNASAGSGIVRITGIFFEGDTFGTGYKWWEPVQHGFIAEKIANAATYRIDNCKFHNTGNTGDYAADIGTNSVLAFGLMDHNYHYSDRGAGKTWMIQRVDASEHPGGVGGTDWSGTVAWSQDMVWGSANFVFIEDCTIKRPNSTSWAPLTIDANAGGRVVFRYNYQENGLIETHSQTGGGNTRSGQGMEIYNNTFVSQWNIYEVLFLRGGTWLIHNNTFRGSPQNWIRMTDTMRAGNWGTVDGTKLWDGNCNSCTNQHGICPLGCGNASYVTGYPYLDQLGMGKAATRAQNSAALQPQVHQPARIWNNGGDLPAGSGAGAETYNKRIVNMASALIVENRDYYFSNDATAEEPGYTPYTYPHPLQTGQQVFQIRPAAPVIVQIQ